MDDSVQTFIKDTLAHYSSQYYDPQKAHEYYLRTRELRERQSGAALKTESKKQAWTYAKKQIGEAEDAEVSAASEARRVFVENARNEAAVRRERISGMLRDFLKQLSDSRKQESDALSEERKRESEKISESEKRRMEAIARREKNLIARLPKIPDGISKRRRAQLMEARAKEVEKIRGDSDKARDAEKQSSKAARDALGESTEAKRDTLSERNSAEKTEARASSALDRESSRQELKNAVDKARSDYEAKKQGLRAKYEGIAQKEYDAIKRQKKV